MMKLAFVRGFDCRKLLFDPLMEHGTNQEGKKDWHNKDDRDQILEEYFADIRVFCRLEQGGDHRRNHSNRKKWSLQLDISIRRPYGALRSILRSPALYLLLSPPRLDLHHHPENLF